MKFSQAIDDLGRALDGGDEEKGKAAVIALAKCFFTDLNRIADALEAISKSSRR